MTTQKTPQSITDLVASTDARNERFRIERAKELRAQQPSQDSVDILPPEISKDIDTSNQKTPQSIKDLVASTAVRNERFRTERPEALRRQEISRRRAQASIERAFAIEETARQLKEDAQVAANLKVERQARSKVLVAEARRINKLREESGKSTNFSFRFPTKGSDLLASEAPETKNQRLVREFDTETKRIEEAFKQAQQKRLTTIRVNATIRAFQEELRETEQANIFAKEIAAKNALRRSLQRAKLDSLAAKSEADRKSFAKIVEIAEQADIIVKSKTDEKALTQQVEEARLATSRRELQQIPRLEQAFVRSAVDRETIAQQVEKNRIVASRIELQQIPRLEQAFTRRRFDEGITAASEIFTLKDFTPEVGEPTKTVMLSSATIRTTQNLVDKLGVIVGTREVLVVKRLDDKILIVPLDNPAIREFDIGRGRKEFFVTLPESQAKIIEAEQREISQANRGGIGLGAATSRILEGISAAGETTVGGALFVGSSIPFTQENIGALKKFREEFDKAKAEGKDILGALRQAEINTDLPRGVKFGLEAVLDPLVLLSGGTVLAIKTGAITSAKITAKTLAKGTVKSVVSSQAGIRPIVRIAGEGLFRASEGELGQTVVKTVASKLKKSTEKFVLGSERQIALGGEFPDVAIAFGKSSFIVQQKLVPKVTGDVIVTGGQARRFLSAVTGKATSFVPQRLGQFERSIFEDRSAGALARAGSSLSDISIKAFKKSTEKARNRLASVAKSAKEGTLGTAERQLSFLGRDTIDIVGQRGSLQVVSKPIFTEPSLNIIPLNIGGKVIKGLGSRSLNLTEGVLTPITRLGVKTTNITVKTSKAIKTASTTFANQAIEIGVSTPNAIRNLVARGLDTNTLRDAVKFSNSKNNVNVAIKELTRRGINVPKRAEILSKGKFVATRGLEAGNVALRSEIIPGVVTTTQFGTRLGKSLFDNLIDATRTKVDDIAKRGTSGKVTITSRGLKRKIDDFVPTKATVTRRSRPILSASVLPEIELEPETELEPIIIPFRDPITIPSAPIVPERFITTIPPREGIPTPSREFTTIPGKEEIEQPERSITSVPGFGGPTKTFRDDIIPSIVPSFSKEDSFITPRRDITIIPADKPIITPFDDIDTPPFEDIDADTTPFDDVDVVPFDDTATVPFDEVATLPTPDLVPTTVPDSDVDVSLDPDVFLDPEPRDDIFIEEDDITFVDEDTPKFKDKASKLVIRLSDDNDELSIAGKRTPIISALKLFRRVTINKVEWTLVERVRQGGRSGFITINAWGPFKITDLAKSGNIGVIARGKLAALANKQGDHPSTGSDLLLALIASGQIEPNEAEMVLPFPVRFSING